MPPEPSSPDALLVATLAAMSRFSQSLRDGTDGSVLAMRVARCLDALADCTALAPALRRDCEQLASLWALLHPGAGRSRSAQPAGATPAGAVVVQLRRPPAGPLSSWRASACTDAPS